MHIRERIQEAFSHYLARVAKENQEVFGGGRLDCCLLNRQQNTQNKKEQG